MPGARLRPRALGTRARRAPGSSGARFGLGALVGPAPPLRELGGDRDDLARLERLAQETEPWTTQAPNDVVPRVVRVGTADAQLDLRGDLQDVLNRLHAVPAGRHPHVGEDD